MPTKHSQHIFRQARDVLVGGVNSPVRSFQAVGGDPLVMKYGRGAQVFDRDGNAYTDYCLSWGALIYGHAHRNVVLAAKKTVERGLSFGTTTWAEVEMARHIVRAVPSIEQVRFVNSGTEAAMSALRLARGFTGRSKIVKFDGCYHGHVDDLLTTAGSGVAQLAASSSQGIPAEHVANTFSLPYNDVHSLAACIDGHGPQIAAVILEPVAGNMGVIPATDEFLQAVRALTQRHGILLIFDEVMTGFRTHPSCVQGEVGVTPDLTCLGKIIGGGFPVGAYGGRRDIMQCLAPVGGVYQAGTFSGNPVVMAAGLATLKLLNADVYRTINARAEHFSSRLNQFFVDEHIPARLSAYKSMLSLRFSGQPVRNYAEARAAADHEQYAALFQHLLKAGIYWPPADLEAFFVSGRHSAKDLEQLSGEIRQFFVGRRAASGPGAG